MIHHSATSIGHHHRSLVSSTQPLGAVASQIEGLAMLDAGSEPHDADVAAPEVGAVAQPRTGERLR